MTKHIFVTGGVVSSLGKGLTSASIGMLLERRGLRVRMQKLDPYINVDPGHHVALPARRGLRPRRRRRDRPRPRPLRTLHARPAQQGLQLHHRQDLPVGDREGAPRRLHGKTVQVIPHITDEIKTCIRKLATPDVDVVITEIGGTVGDIEGMPYFEAIRQFALDVGRQNCLFIHLTLVPVPEGRRRTEDQADAAQRRWNCARSASSRTCSSAAPSAKSRRRTARRSPSSATSSARAVIEEKDKEFSIYEVPLGFAENKVDELIADKLGLPLPRPLADRRLAADARPDPQPGPRSDDRLRRQVRQAPRRLQVRLRVARPRRHRPPREGAVVRIDSEKLDRGGGREGCSPDVDGLLVPGGFDKRGIEGKIDAIRFARETRAAVLRHLPGPAVRDDRVRPQCASGWPRPTAPSSTQTTPHPVVCLLDEQRKITQIGGTMRLGRLPVPPRAGHEGPRTHYGRD